MDLINEDDPIRYDLLRAVIEELIERQQKANAALRARK